MITADLIAFAESLADAAGAAIRPFFRQRFDVETKADASPVTAADRASEAAMRRLIEAQFPGHGIIGEEYGRVRADSRFVWVLDPIDGTRAFIAGRPLFGTLIALLRDGRPVLGVIDQPIIGDRWVGAEGHATRLGARPCRPRACTSLSAAYLATTSPFLFAPGADQARFDRLRGAVKESLYGGDCHNYGLVAAGHVDLVVEAGLQLYDFAALVPVVEGAGGRMTDWTGQPLDANSDGHVIAVGDPGLIAPVIAALA